MIELNDYLNGRGIQYSFNGVMPGDPAEITEQFLADTFEVHVGPTPTAAEISSEYEQVLKSAEKTRINTERAARLERLTVEYQGNTYDADAAAQANVNRVINGVTARLALPQTINWRDADNVTRTLTQNDVFRLGELMLMHVQIIYETSWALKEAIEAAPTLEAAQAITWPE